MKQNEKLEIIFNLSINISTRRQEDIGNKIKYLLINENQIERGLLSKYTTMLLNSYWALKNNYIPIINFQYRNYEIKENQFNDLFLTDFELRKEKAGNNEYIRDSRNPSKSLRFLE